MRVLFFSSYTGLGGGETSLLGLLGAFDRSRLEPILCCPREGPLPAAARSLGVDVRVIPWRPASIWFLPELSARSSAVLHLLDLMDAVRPDVVHTDFHTLPYVIAACRRRGLPLVFTCLGWWFRPRPWQRRVYRLPGVTTVAISEAVRRGFLGTPPFMPASRIAVVPLGVNPAVYRPRPAERDAIRVGFGFAVHAPLVTLAGRFQDVKGHHVFLDMARRILDTRSDVQFAVAGDNAFGVAADAAYQQRVLSIAASDPALAKSVRFLGFVSRCDELLAASDVVVCSSRFESFGMVHIEAMASGVPVVSTNVGGPAETIVDGTTGWLVPPDRPDLLADRVRGLLDDPDERRRMGAAGRARVLAHFTLDRYAASMADLFASARRPAITSS